MLIPFTDADGILLDLRYASVDESLGRAAHPRPAWPLPRLAAACERWRPAPRAVAPAPSPRCAKVRSPSVAVGRGGARRPAGRRGRGGEALRERSPALAGLEFFGACLALASAAALAGCARDAEPATFAVPRAAAAQIRMTCPPGTFIGAMTVNCPQPLTRAAPAR